MRLLAGSCVVPLRVVTLSVPGVASILVKRDLHRSHQVDWIRLEYIGRDWVLTESKPICSNLRNCIDWVPL